MSIYTCKCGVSYKNVGLLSMHIRKAHYNNDEQLILQNSFYCELSKRYVLNELKDYHHSRFMNCNHCNKLFFPRGKIKFCSSSCSAKVANKNRTLLTGKKKKVNCMDCSIEFETSNRADSKKSRCKQCNQIKIKNYKDSINPLIINGIKYNKCHHCEELFERVGNQIKKYCDEHKDRYTAGARNGYIFSFDYEKYPDLFDINEIKRIGFFSTSESPRNYDRLVKDHKISVHDAIKHGYETYYITHPLNCSFITARDNMKKHKNSSITYDELVKMVDAYDKNK